MGSGAPARYAPVQRTLDGATLLFVAGVSWLLMGLLYFGFFTPLRGCRALARRDPLQLKAGPSATTYFRPLPRGDTTDRFKRQF